jgi:hypothetical protein
VLHTLATPELTSHAPLPQITSVGVRFEVVLDDALSSPPPALERRWDAGIVMDRLLARGISVVEPKETPAKDRPLVCVWVLGSRFTSLTRWTQVPWGFVSLATLGLVPMRDAQEWVVEVQVVDAGARADRRIRTARRSYVVANWTGLPLIPWVGDADAALAAAHREGLARAFDEALDAVMLE